jgi:hypothetical protein
MLTEKEALEFYHQETWRDWTDDEIVKFQLYEECLCVPWSRLHAAVDAVLNRSVGVQEFCNMEKLQAEYEAKHGL